MKVEIQIILLLGVFLPIQLVIGAVPPANLIPSGSRFVAMSGCSLGQTLAPLSTLSGRTHENCHCWGFSGYICDPIKLTACPFDSFKNAAGKNCSCQLSDTSAYTCT